MPPGVGNFQDDVILNQDTLTHEGAAFQMGTTSASTVQLGMSNSAGMVAYQAVPTGNATVSLPLQGTILTNVNLSAGTTSQNLSAFVFSNSNNVSFGLSGSTVTASAGAGAGSVNFSAGTTSNNLTAVTFSNSNNISFGLNASTITASVTVATLSNSNNVSFGINASTITASAQGNVSAGTTSNNLSAVVFSNSNGVSFGLNGSTVTGSIATSLTGINLSAGTTSNNLSAVTFSNSNNISFGLNASTVTGSFALKVSAGTASNNLSAVTFSNSNGISFGINASTVTAVFGGMSSWSQGEPGQATIQSSIGFFSFQPIILPYALTVTAFNFLQNVSPGTSNSSAAVVYSFGLYTFNGGHSGTLSLLSSTSSNFTWTSGVQLTSSSGVNIWPVTVASWALTPGPYMFAFMIATTSNVNPSITLAGFANNVTAALGTTFWPMSNGQTLLSNIAFPGISASTTGAFPSSFAVTNTTAYVRTNTKGYQQPWLLMQGS